MEKPKAAKRGYGENMVVAAPGNRSARLAGLFSPSLSLNDTMAAMRKELRQIFNAEALTIYFVDPRERQLVSRIKAGRLRREIRLAIDRSSIAGYVAEKGRGVCIGNVRDRAELAAIDPGLRFNSTWDQATSFKTVQVLATPVVHGKKVLGVIQLLNKKGSGRFTPVDEHNLEYVAEKLAAAIQRDRAFQAYQPCYQGLVENGYISASAMKRAARMSREQGQDLEKILRREFKIGKRDMGTVLARFYGVEYEDLATTHYNPVHLFKDKNFRYFQQEHCVPLAIEDNRMLLAVNNPHDHGKILEVQHIFGALDVKLCFSLKEDIENFIFSFQSGGQMRMDIRSKSVGDIIGELDERRDHPHQEEDDFESADINDNSVVLLVRKIIEDAHYHLASDIHIEPYGQNRDALVRFRVDGRCKKVLTLPRGYVRAVVSRIKVLAKMDIAEKRKPQDGKIRFRTSSGKMVELRVVTMPTAGYNEDVVLRVLGGVEPLPLEKIMRQETFERFNAIIRKPYGIVLVVGPTGSGKTTTLHSALNAINDSERKIWTAEDPVEITQYGLRQVQVNPKSGLTFAQAMRGFLRADPDVIMVGEMRDRETVGMGIEASLTGHLVFSTLHTNSAPETIIRLIDMGMDPYNFADSLLGILAQRLVRILCGSCRTAYAPDLREYEHIRETYGPYFDQRVNMPHHPGLKLHRARGCYACRDLGYAGRKGLYELLLGDRNLKELIIGKASVDEFRRAAEEGGMTTLLQDGIHRVFAGETDMKQVMSVCLR